MPTTIPRSDKAFINAVATVVLPDLDWPALIDTIGTDRSRFKAFA